MKRVFTVEDQQNFNELVKRSGLDPITPAERDIVIERTRWQWLKLDIWFAWTMRWYKLRFLLSILRRNPVNKWPVIFRQCRRFIL